MYMYPNISSTNERALNPIDICPVLSTKRRSYLFPTCQVQNVGFEIHNLIFQSEDATNFR